MAKASTLVAQLRLDLEDPELPGNGDDSDSLWSTAEMLHALDVAQNRFSEDTDCFSDATNFTSTYSAGDKWITLDPLITQIRRGYLTSAGTYIDPITSNVLDDGFQYSDYGVRISGKWQTATGTPYYAVTDLEAGKIRLVPEPTSGDTIEWRVYRRPLIGITKTSVIPEIPVDFHYDLLVWAKRELLRKQDAETVDMDRSQEFEREWYNDVIPRAHRYFRRKHRQPGTVTYGGL